MAKKRLNCRRPGDQPRRRSSRAVTAAVSAAAPAPIAESRRVKIIDPQCWARGCSGTEVRREGENVFVQLDHKLAPSIFRAAQLAAE